MVAVVTGGSRGIGRAITLALLGAGYAALIRDTVYTAENEVIFAINIVEYDDEGVGYVSATNNLNYAGRYISTVQQHISTPKYVNEANNIYSHAGNEGAIDGKAIKMNYGDDTLIFSITFFMHFRHNVGYKTSSRPYKGTTSIKN